MNQIIAAAVVVTRQFLETAVNKDDFGDRMKAYEKMETGRRCVPLLPVYARMDGRSFSNFTSVMARPYDSRLSQIMIEVTKWLVERTGARCGYTQSDEISLVWLSDDYNKEIMFDSKLQKMVSVLAAMTTVKFNQLASAVWPDRCGEMCPVFDARVFQLPNLVEAANAFLWREKDATKNAISMAARSVYSHNALHEKSGSEMQEMMFQKGINFNDYPAFFKRGTFVQKRKRTRTLTDDERLRIPEKHRPEPHWTVERSEYITLDMPPFTKVTNRVEVIFSGEDPKTAAAEHTVAELEDIVPDNCP